MSSESSRANPGNFANRDRDEVAQIGRKGGSRSHQQDVRNMDAETLVGGYNLGFSVLFFFVFRVSG